MPARKDERWRFSNVGDLDLSAYTTATPLDDAEADSVIAKSHGLTEVGGRMVFGNDQLLVRDRVQDSLARSGVIFQPLEQAWAEHEDLVRRYFMREEAILGGQKFAALHAARVKAGTFLYVPRGVEISLPLETHHWLGGANQSVFPHTLIVAEDNARVTMVDFFRSTDNTAPGFACGVNDLWLGSGAQVTYVCTQQWSRKTLAIQINSTVVGRDATARALLTNLGSHHFRGESVSRLAAPGGRSDMLAVTVADGSQEIDQRTFQIHEAPNTSSDLLYKNALDDSARTIFSGLIRVEPDAHQTDAYQKVRNLLLSDEAEANSAPGLEIEADDVRCTHGATSGQIDEEELFYLRSRGIPIRQARRLIVKGFLQDAIERLQHPALADHLGNILRERFDQRH